MRGSGLAYPVHPAAVGKGHEEGRTSVEQHSYYRRRHGFVHGERSACTVAGWGCCEAVPAPSTPSTHSTSTQGAKGTHPRKRRRRHDIAHANGWGNGWVDGCVGHVRAIRNTHAAHMLCARKHSPLARWKLEVWHQCENGNRRDTSPPRAQKGSQEGCGHSHFRGSLVEKARAGVEGQRPNYTRQVPATACTPHTHADAVHTRWLSCIHAEPLRSEVATRSKERACAGLWKGGWMDGGGVHHTYSCHKPPSSTRFVTRLNQLNSSSDAADSTTRSVCEEKGGATTCHEKRGWYQRPRVRGECEPRTHPPKPQRTHTHTVESYSHNNSTQHASRAIVVQEGARRRRGVHCARCAH
jgi:hypothetical protein